MGDFVVEIWHTPMPWPLSLACHVWFVTRHANSVDRFEVWATLGKFSGSALQKNAVAPEVGFRTSFFDDPIQPKKIGIATKIFEITGDSSSQVAQLYCDIHSSAVTYPYTQTYRMWPGPNSNTYVQWVLNRHPQITWELPWNAFGKNYR